MRLLVMIALVGCTSQSAVRFRTDQPQVPTGADVIELGGTNVGYRVVAVPATDQHGRPTTLDVAVWYPTPDAEQPFAYHYSDNAMATHVANAGRIADGRFPLVVFSHGATGSGLTSAFITETLARHGFIVASIDHTDDVYLARIREGHIDQRIAAAGVYALRVARVWLGDNAVAYRPTIAYRPAQLRATIDYLVAASSPFAGHVDDRAIGVMGHSFGAWTAMAVAGGIAAFADPRVTAVVTLSAPVGGFTAAEVARIHTPLLLMFGATEVDQGRRDDRSYFYDRLAAPKYMLEIEDAVHTTFSGGVRLDHDSVDGYLADVNRAAIVRYVIAFMRFHLAGDTRARDQLSTRGRGVSNYLYAR